MVLSFHASAQKRKNNYSFNKKKKEENTFLHKQWWIGLKGGVNLTNVTVEKAYSIITPTNYEARMVDKVYRAWKPVSAQFGLDINFYFRGFSASFQPGYQSIKFNYTNDYQWLNAEDASKLLELSYLQEQQAEYLVFPLLVRYEKQFGKLSPYIQAGAYSVVLLDATKQVTVTSTDYASGGVNEFQGESISVGVKDLFADYHYGLTGGAGLYYTVGNVRFNLDVQYKYGMSLINSVENRYGNDRLAGTGDAMDDLLLRNVSISFGTLFPLRFLSSGFKSFDSNK